MNWIKNFVRPRFPSVFREHDDTPDNLWEACKKCGEMIFHRDLENLQKVCPGCDHHMRIGATARFQALFDKGEYELLDLPDVAHDPLKFKDQKKYAERLKEARAKSGDKDAVKVAKGDLGGRPAIIAVQDFALWAALWVWPPARRWLPPVKRHSPIMRRLSWSRQPAVRACRKVFYRSCKCRAPR